MTEEPLKDRAAALCQLITARTLLRQYVARDQCECIPGFALRCRRCTAVALIEGEIAI